MVEYIKEDIEEVMQITGLDYVKSEKLFNEVVKDIDDGSDDELNSFDIIDIIKTEKKVKDTGADKKYVTSEKEVEKKGKGNYTFTKRERKPTMKKGKLYKKLLIFFHNLLKMLKLSK